MHLCNGVVACVIIRPLGSPSLCKQAELMSPSGVEDKDRRPHDSLTVELNRLPSHHYSAQSKQPPAFILTTPNGRSKSNTITYKPLKFLNLYIINLTEKLNRIASVNACLTS